MTIYTNQERMAAILAVETTRQALATKKTYPHLAVGRALELACQMHEKGMDLSVFRELNYKQEIQQ